MTDAISNVDAILKLPAVLDLAAAEGLLATVRERVQLAPSLRVDASGVETLTLPCIQIIFAATRDHEQVAIENPSDAFAAAFMDLALDWGQGRGPTASGPAQDSQQVCEQSLDQAQAQPEEPVLQQALEQVLEQVGELAQEPSEAQVLEQAQEQAQSRIEAPAQQPAQEPVQAQVEEPAQEPARESAEPQVHVSAPEQMQEPAQDQDNTDELSMAKKILTIDDSKTIRDMLMLTLADAGFEVIQAVDGQDGINVLGDQQVDVVITDINMPKMDGYAVIRHLRRSAVHKTTPILVLTTESDTEKKHLAREAGATGWMVKPFDPDRLVATIRRVSP